MRAVPFASLAACRFGPPKFEPVVDEFAYTSLSFSPTAATEYGLHRFASDTMDDLLDDWGASAIAKSRKFYERFQGDLQRIAVNRLMPEDRADFDIVQEATALRLREHREEHHRHAPHLYTAIIEKGLTVPYRVEYAPLNLRYFHLIRRIEAIPKLLKLAQGYLVDGASRDIEAAADRTIWLREWITATLAPGVPQELRASFTRATGPATAALVAYEQFVRSTLKRIEPPAAADASIAGELDALIEALNQPKRRPRIAARDAARPTAEEIASAKDFLRRRALAPKLIPEATLPGGPDEALARTLFAWREAVPGLAVQDAYAAKITPNSRRILRSYFASPETRAGWSEYAAHMMIEEGASLTDPGIVEAQEQHWLALATAARNGDTQAAVRYRGWRDMLRLSAAARSKRGKAFSLAQFHEQVLAAGPIPIATMARLLAVEPLAPLSGADLLPVVPVSEG